LFSHGTNNRQQWFIEDVVEEIHRKKEIESTANKELELVKRKSAQALYKCRGYLKLQSHEEKETGSTCLGLFQ
jgi:hypothetical protein